MENALGILNVSSKYLFKFGYCCTVHNSIVIEKVNFRKANRVNVKPFVAIGCKIIFDTELTSFLKLSHDTLDCFINKKIVLEIIKKKPSLSSMIIFGSLLDKLIGYRFNLIYESMSDEHKIISQYIRYR